MKILQEFWIRFRYPFSLPEDIARALGVQFSNDLSFQEFVYQLTHLHQQPKNLKKFMPREQAEAAFRNALKKDKFSHLTLCSYYFPEGWLEFILQFDDQSRLRRIYLQHKVFNSDKGIELPLMG